MFAQTPAALHCRNCEKPLRGRIDKKFCDDRCRNLFNNQKRNGNDKRARYINSILNKNRRILRDLYKARRFRVKKATLLQLGFLFSYHTHRFRVQRGKICACYYDFGLIPTLGESYKLVNLETVKLERLTS